MENEQNKEMLNNTTELTAEELASAAGGFTLKSIICPYCYSDNIVKVDVYIDTSIGKLHYNRKCNSCTKYYNA